jgi:hypothetical protein
VNPNSNPFTWTQDASFPKLIEHLTVFGTKTTTFVFYSKDLKSWFVSHLDRVDIGTARPDLGAVKELAQSMFRESVRQPTLVQKLVKK